MVNGLPQFEASKTVCIDCMVGTQHRNPIPKKSTWRASSKLQLIHADICGPIKLISNSKKRYLNSFIDDFSRKAWIYFLDEKSEALVIFKQYKSCVEKETGFILSVCILIEGVSSLHKTLMNFVKKMASRGSWQWLTLRNRTELQRGRIRPSWTWFEVCFQRRSFQRLFSQKLWIGQCIF